MTVTVDELVLLVGKQAIELDRLRRDNEALRAALDQRQARIEELEQQQQPPAAEGREHL